MLCCKRRKAETSLVTLQLREVVNIEVAILVVRKRGQDLAFNDAAHRLHFSASLTGRMEELQVMRALGMSIDLMRPVAAATLAHRRRRCAAQDGHTHRNRLDSRVYPCTSPLCSNEHDGIEMAYGSRS